jgi:1,4-dihydroxy-2-naphthoate octaprenyltransferase
MSTSSSFTARSPLPAPATPNRVRIWLKAIRIFSFTASAVPILAGSALALVDRSFDVPLFLLLLAASFACHAGSNLANDYFDHAKGVDSAASMGPSEAVQKKLLTPSQIKRGMFVAFAIATVLGLIIVKQSSWWILALALASLAAAVLYTGGPKPLGYMALGEVTVFIFMGPVMVGGAYYVLAGEIVWRAILLSIPVGLLVANILHANNIRDMELDRQAGKTTLANLFGRRFSDLEFLVLTAGAYLVAVAWVILDFRYWPLLATLITLPTAVDLIGSERRAADAPQLNRVLRRSAGLHLRFGLLLTAGLLVRTLLDRI